MCFGNKLNQNRPEHCITPFPTHNNFCGGFALNAVLVDLGSGTCPIEVYMRIQDYQNKEIIKAALLCLCHRGYALHLKIM